MLCDRGSGIEGGGLELLLVAGFTISKSYRVATGDHGGSAWRGRWGLVGLSVFGLFESEDGKHVRRRRPGRRREEDALKQLLLEGPKKLSETRSVAEWFENLPFFRKPKEAGTL